MSDLLDYSREQNALHEFSSGLATLPDPLVSVSVVTYRHEAYIRQCLDSILAQRTDFPYEIIVGEDDSPDQTRAICMEYAKQYPTRIRLFLRSRENVIYCNGIPTGRFNSLSNLLAARGRYIAFCEGDDYWTDEYKLQKQLDFMRATPDCSMSFHAAKLDSPDGKHRGHIIMPSKQNRFYCTEDIIMGGGGMFPTASMMVVRDALYPIPDYYLKASVGDMPIALMSASHGRVGYMHEVMAAYRKGTPYSWNAQMNASVHMQINHHVSHIMTLISFNEVNNWRYAKVVQAKTKQILSVLKKSIVLRILGDNSGFGLRDLLCQAIRSSFLRHTEVGKHPPIAIFGTGESAEDLWSLLEYAGCASCVRLVVDNAQLKWGDTFHGLPVVSPSVIREKPRNWTLLIASMYVQEIMKQLRCLCGANAPITYCDHDLFAAAFHALFPVLRLEAASIQDWLKYQKQLLDAVDEYIVPEN